MGSMLAFSPGEIHRARVVSPEEYSYRMVYLSADDLGAVGVGCPPDQWGFQAVHESLMRHDRTTSVEGRFIAAIRLMMDRCAMSADPGLPAADVRVAERELGTITATPVNRLRISTVADAWGSAGFT
jgi:hypothetical protein